MTPTHHDPDDYYEAVRRQYAEFERESLRRRDEGEVDYRPQIWYYAPGGEAFRVAYVAREVGSDVLELQSQDQQGNPSVVITSTLSAQIVVMLVVGSEPERPPVGFGSRNAGPLT